MKLANSKWVYAAYFIFFILVGIQISADMLFPMVFQPYSTPAALENAAPIVTKDYLGSFIRLVTAIAYLLGIAYLILSASLAGKKRRWEALIILAMGLILIFLPSFLVKVAY